jgi:DNA-binding transcriptional MocR family regulator
VIAWLPPGLEETPFVDAAAAKGIALSGLSRYHNDPATARQGLLFGYGRVTESQIEEGIGVVASALG